MEQPSRSRKKRLTYGLRSIFLLVTLVGCCVGYWIYREKALKPDLSVNAYDLAWAADILIWKLDLSDVGPFFGLQVVAIEDDGTRHVLVGHGGYELVDTRTDPVVRVAIERQSSKSLAKLFFHGTTANCEFTEHLDGNQFSRRSLPQLEGDCFELISCSKDDPNNANVQKKTRIVLELIRDQLGLQLHKY